MGQAARRSRFFSAVSLSISCRRRATSAAKTCVCSSDTGRTGGRMASANRAKICASSRSVLANCPVARAKSRTCRGLITTTGSPAAASAPRQRYFEAARRFEHNQGGLQGLKPLDGLRDPTLVIRNLEGGPGLDRHIDTRVRHIQADKNLSAHGAPPSLPSLHHAGSRPSQLSGLVNGGTGRPELPTVFSHTDPDRCD